MTLSNDQFFALHPRASRSLSIYLAAVHGLAVIVVLPLPLHMLLKMGVIGGLIMSFAVSVRTHILFKSINSVVAAYWLPEKGWLVDTPRENGRQVRLLAGSVVHPRLIVMRFASDGGRYTLILPNDALKPEVARRLRVRLRSPEADGQESEFSRGA